MTGRDCSSPWFSWWSAALLFWGTTTVGSLVDQGSENRQSTTPGNYLIQGGANNTNESSNGESIVIRECGEKTPICEGYCIICNGLDQMWCLSEIIEHQCHIPFRIHMDLHNSTNWCVWSNVRSAYNNFTTCTEEIAECLLIPWPNPMVEEMFLQIHGTYFHDCPTEELSDPPPAVVLALVMTPICLIPVMVVLVVLKTKNGDGSS
ncbi:receptor activity-modifying protein 2 isoform X1 [Gadus morhua]|nr:receptor activity-modifying protein 2 isoform X1 [Gadus morhua]